MPVARQPPSMAVVTEVAEREGVDPMDLQPPLWDAIDPEALDRLYKETSAEVSVEFEYGAYSVRVDKIGEVHVDESEPPVH